MKLSIDSMGIVDGIMNENTMIYLHEQFKNDKNQFLFSLKSKEEIINVLIRDYNYNPNDAEKEFNNFVASFEGTVETYIEEDKKESFELVRKYSHLGCHYPDSLIIAHLHRLKVDKIITRDSAVQKVITTLGMKFDIIPTQSVLLRRKFQKLYGRHH